MLNSKTAEYLHLREHYRKQAERDFFAYREKSPELVTATGEVVAGMAKQFTQFNFNQVQQGQYIADLVTSFCRSHFIALDLILSSELLEASAIIRKQIELLARLHEVRGKKENIVGRTPNIGVLYSKKLKRLYSGYSEATHSASPQVMELLGKANFEGRRLTSVFPVFHVNSYITMQHLCLTVVEFYNWTSNFIRQHFPDNDISAMEAQMNRMLDVGEKIFNDGTIPAPVMSIR